MREILHKHEDQIHIEKSEYPDSLTYGTPAKKGCIKVYFNVDDIEKAQHRIKEAIALRDYINEMNDLPDEDERETITIKQPSGMGKTKILGVDIAKGKEKTIIKKPKTKAAKEEEKVADKVESEKEIDIEMEDIDELPDLEDLGMDD